MIDTGRSPAGVPRADRPGTRRSPDRRPVDVAAPDRLDALLTIVVALLAVAFQWPIADRWLALLDEGYILAIADDINRGNVLYRDITIDNPLPGAFYLLAWWFRLVGASVATSRILAVAGFAIYVAAFYRIARELLPRSWCLGVVALLLCYRVWAFPHWHIYSYSLVSASFAGFAAACVFAGTRRRSISLIAVAGVALGGSVLAKQDYGLSVLGALGLALLLLPWLEAPQRPTWRQALGPGFTLGVSALAVVGPAIGYFAWEGALGELVKQTLLFPLSAAQKFSYTQLPSPWPLFSQDSALRAQIGSYFPSILATLWWYPCPGCWVSDMSRGWVYQQTAIWDATLKILYWLPLTVYAAAAAVFLVQIALRRRRGEPMGDLGRFLLLLAFAGGFLLAFNRPRDWVHLMMIYPPALLVGAVLLHRVVSLLPAILAAVTRAALLAGLALLFVASVALMMDLRTRIAWPLKTARGGVYVDPTNGPIIEDVLEYASAIPIDEPLPVYPVQPMLNFLAGRTTAGGYYVIWPVQDEQRDARIIQDLEARRIHRVIYSLSQYAHLRPFQTNAPRLFDYLVERYEIDHVFSREPFGPLLVALRRRGATRDRVPLADLVDSPEVAWEKWPFGSVMTQAVGTENHPQEVRLRFSVPAGQNRLALAPGVNPDRWLALKGGPFTFRIEGRYHMRGKWSELRELLTMTLDPGKTVRDRRWAPTRIDLSEFAGRRAELRFSIVSREPLAEPLDLAGWLDPVLTAPPERKPRLPLPDRVTKPPPGPGGKPPRRRTPLPTHP